MARARLIWLLFTAMTVSFMAGRETRAAGSEVSRPLAVPQPPNASRTWMLILAAALIGIAGAGGEYLRNARQSEAVATALTGGNARHAPVLMLRYGCAGCHEIPGVPGADGRVAGPLSNLRQRVYIAGKLPNTAGNLIRWITAPDTLSPDSAMPRTGVSEREARDIAAYLYRK